MKKPGIFSRRRRGFLGAFLAALAAPFPGTRRAQAQGRIEDTKQSIESIVPAVKDVTRGAVVRPGRVKLETPLLADNGHSVPLTVTVQSPMTKTDYVRSLTILSERNPRPLIARFQFSPLAGRAQIVTRIRLNGAQRVVAVAEMSDGSFWSDTAEIVVTESACLDAG